MSLGRLVLAGVVVALMHLGGVAANAAVPTVFGVHAQSKVWSPTETGYLSKYASIADMLGPGAVVRDWWSWYDIEPSQGTYKWTQPDAAVSRAVAQGQRLIVCVYGAPTWANGHTDTTWPATDITIWKRFLTDAVNRYKNTGAIIVWELWNEQNSPLFYESGPTPDWKQKARDFASKVLIPGYDAVKAADPEAIVALGGFSPNWSSDSPGAPPYEHEQYFLQQMLSVASAASHLDYVGYHPYLDSADPVAFVTAVGQMRSMMASFGIGGKPLIATEWGALSRTAPTDEEQCNRMMQQAMLIQKCGFLYACYHYVIDAEGVGYGLFDNYIPTGPSRPDWSKIAYAYEIYTKLLAGSGYEADAVFATAPQGVQGYVFTQPGQRITAVWSNASNGQASLRAAWNTTAARQVQRIGQTRIETVMPLGPDRVITISVSANPVFVMETVPSTTPATIGSLRTGFNGLPVTVENAVVSAVLVDCFYAQQADRAAGVRVCGEKPFPAVGQRVAVTGRVDNSGPNLTLADSHWSIYPGEPITVVPIGMNLRNLGGETIQSGSGLNNTGILAAICGRITEIDSAGAYFFIDDGSRVTDNLNSGVNVETDGRAFHVGEFLWITGISACYRNDQGQVARLVRITNPSSIQPLH